MANIRWILVSIMLLFYACTVMYLLLDVKFKSISTKRKVGSLLFFFIFLACNVVAQLILGHELYGKFYLLLTQLPVYFLFMILSEYRGVKLLFVLLTAVFFSSLFMSIGIMMQHPPLWTYLIFGFLLIVLICKFFKKPFNYMLATAENRVFMLFTAIPLVYYTYSYSMTQYQLMDIVLDKLYIIHQLPLLIVLMAYLLLVQIFKMISEKAELTNIQNLASVQLNAATAQIEQLRVAERNFTIYRHDLRHHLTYLNACILEDKLQEAITYIQQTCDDMNNMRLTRYSLNESLNLILSSYVSKAEATGIAMEVNVSAQNYERFQITDLCSLLANASENAINACLLVENPSERYIKLRMYEKSNKLCVDLRNAYLKEPVFEHKVPVSHEEGHGIGVKSMMHVVEKYEGVCGFSAKDGVFIFQASM